MVFQTSLKGCPFSTPGPPGGSTVSWCREVAVNCQAFLCYSSVISAAWGIRLQEYVRIDFEKSTFDC